MHLEEYFDFETNPVERIRLKGTRIDLDFIVEYFKMGMTPEQIATHFTTPLELEQVYAAITYYLHNRDSVEGYLQRRESIGDENQRAYLAQGPSELSKKLRAAKANRAANAQESS